MNSRSALLSLLVIVAGAGGCASTGVRTVTDAQAPRALPEQGPVSVRWEDPAGFSEIRYSHNSAESRRGNWVEELALYLRQRAEPRLPPGERLEVDITDIERAGDYEPWHGPQLHDVRIMRDYYPPRLSLRFRRTDASGRVIAEGERRLSDSGYLMGGAPLGNSNDPLRFEKDMIDRWLRRELTRPQG